MIPPGRYYMDGGNVIRDLVNITFQLDGTLTAPEDCFDGCWPVTDSLSVHGKSLSVQHARYSETAHPNLGKSNGQFEHYLHFVNCDKLTITSSGPGSRNGYDINTNPNATGLIDGNGKGWWNKYVFGNHSKSPHRPKLLVIEDSTDVTVTSLTLHNSPSFNLMLDGVDGAEVSYIRVTTDRWDGSKMTWWEKAIEDFLHLKIPSIFTNLQPEDLNTDGIDPRGRNIWIHHVNIENDDDSIAVKPSHEGDFIRGTPVFCTENILIEDSTLVGFGASVGSVPPSPNHNCVRNVTFRNISMPKTGKGIYVKSNPQCIAGNPNVTSEITDIVYEDVTITKPLWWPIWVGPQQQHEPGSALGSDCALDYPLGPCPTQGCVSFRGVTLRRVTITDPVFSPGVIKGNSSNPMQGIVLEDVLVQNPGEFPFFGAYECEDSGVDRSSSVANGTTSPLPPCLA